MSVLGEISSLGVLSEAFEHQGQAMRRVLRRHEAVFNAALILF
jgi:hypothetical protein